MFKGTYRYINYLLNFFDEILSLLRVLEVKTSSVADMPRNIFE